MALVDDLLKGGNVTTGLAVGVTALIAWPLIPPLSRPLAKIAIKTGIVACREAKRIYDNVAAGIQDLTKEAIEEMGSEVAKEAVKQVGTNLAEEAVEENGPELATEAVEEIGAEIVEEAV